jgi:hypothetical protein
MPGEPKAFAVTSFQMLTGALPFECATIAATLFRIVHEPPLFPEGMGSQLRAVFEKALAKQPADRYPDLAGFMGALIAAVELPADTRAKLLAAWELQPRSFLLDVTSSPDGARVLLAGREIGRTDLLRAWIPGNGGTLRVELEGYQPEELEVRTGAGPIHLVLIRPPFTVRVDTDPPGAEALLNGVSQGTTPIQALQVPGNGRQELVLRWRDRQVWSQLLDKDTPLPALIQLEPRPVVARPHAAAPVVPSGKALIPPAPVMETRAPVEARPPVLVRLPVLTAPSAAPVLKGQTPAEDRGRR